MIVPARFFRSTDELRAWFEAHHADTSELWVGFYKAHTGRAGVVYLEAVDEALCFGWIDTTVRRIDADRYANRFTPRRPGSRWSTVNRQRFAALEKAGRIHEAGRSNVDRRTPTRTTGVSGPIASLLGSPPPYANDPPPRGSSDPAREGTDEGRPSGS